MTQLALGLDRDSGVVSELFDERNDAVKALLSGDPRGEKQGTICWNLCGGVRPTMKTLLWLMEEGSTACR